MKNIHRKYRILKTRIRNCIKSCHWFLFKYDKFQEKYFSERKMSLCVGCGNIHREAHYKIIIGEQDSLKMVNPTISFNCRTGNRSEIYSRYVALNGRLIVNSILNDFHKGIDTRGIVITKVVKWNTSE